MSARCSHSAIGSTTISSAAGRRARKALATREFLPVVHHVHAEVDLAGGSGELPADMSGADDVQPGGGLQWIDMDIHLSAADEAVLLCEVVVQFEVEEHLPA